eukprot:GHRR01024231.1.p1 GENE.GHRR01024231.1~~GHRR01024231.1.p1  ORF type:complete len:471 (+),score=117.16 GHRR01024231.1:181-1593(+)
MSLKEAVHNGVAQCASNRAVCDLFDSWSGGSTPPCAIDTCTACTLEDSSCGVYQPVTNTTTCNYRYVECTGSRVTRIVLDFAVVDSTGPRIVFSSIPAGLANIEQLRELYLSTHKFMNGALPPEFASLANLEVLHLTGSNASSGGLPGTWSALTQLRSLWLLDMAGIMGELSGSFDAASTSPAPSSGPMPAPTTPSAAAPPAPPSPAAITPELPDSWKALINLQQLRISAAPGVTGTIPESWSNLTQLQMLELSGLSLSGQLPSGWVTNNMSAVTNITLSDMPQLQLPAKSITYWATNRNMMHFVLRNVGGLSGSTFYYRAYMVWPDWKKNLTTLVLSKLGLTGTIPDSWEWLPAGKLQTLDLSSNAITGTLPNWVGNLLAANAVLDLSNNQIQGILPSTWAQSNRSIEVLRLGNNSIGGAIPDSWNSLAYRAREFNMSQNKLQGWLPAAWNDIAWLKSYTIRLSIFDVK